jgi:signal transduction histidine kinase
LLSLETNGQISNPAGCKTRDGRLWFPTTQGVAVIDPRKVALDDVPPLAAIEIVRANGAVVFNTGPTAANPVGARAELQSAKALATDSQLSTLNPQLPPGSARVLEFRYTANAFVAPEKARFKYRLVGLDENWIEAGTRREAYFADLRPGDYQFEVIAANHHGVWQENGATFGFRLAPFIHQTWWFYLVCGGTTIVLVAGIVFWRIRELRRIHRLEQQAAVTGERTRLAKDLHDGLGADLTRLTMLADLASGDAASGTGEHLRKLSKSSRDVARELKELIWIANPANDTVDGLVSRICQSAEDFLRDARIKLRLDLAPDLPQQQLSIDQRRNLLLVAREALNNIAKHAGATEVCIRASGDGNSLQLAIEDNGRGFDLATARPDGLGLSSMRRRVENLDGTFHLESRLGTGTKIAIQLKLGQAK